MSYPAQRLTINTADYSLLKPGLELLANGLANAKLGLFPHRNVWHRIDLQASNVYQHQAFDQAMADRIIAVRLKLWDLNSSRRIRVDVFEVAVLALAGRLRNTNVGARGTRAESDELKSLARRLESCRKRAKRATISRLGDGEYRLAADRWGGFVSWSRFNLLSFTASKLNRPWRKQVWRSQREQLGVAIGTLLTSKFYESPSKTEMKRMVTLLASNLRRHRLQIGLRELLSNPSQFSDLVVNFVIKRMSLNLLPNAPLPAWQVITNRTDKFEAYRNRRAQACGDVKAQAPPADSGSPNKLTRTTEAPARDKFTPRKLDVSDQTLQTCLAEWVRREIPESFWMPVRDQGHFLIRNGLTERCRRSFTANTLAGLIEELRPPVAPVLAEEPINEFADWLLSIVLAVRAKPYAIYDAVSHAVGHAVRLEKEAMNAR